MQNSLFSGLAALCLAFAPAHAAIVVTFGGTSVPGQGIRSSVVNAITVDFNVGAVPTTGPAVYSPGTVITGTVLPFGTALPSNTSPYLTVGPAAGSPVTIDLAEPTQYFGFYAGSLDTFNLIQFFAGSTKVLERAGNTLSGNYVNVFATDASEFFTRVVLSSSGNSFETDNHAFRTVVDAIRAGDLPNGIGGFTLPDPNASAVPEPSTAALAAAVLAFFAWRRR
jgi:hypothetical protein